MLKIPKSELDTRLQRVKDELSRWDDRWQYAAVIGKINIFYLTGTMVDGLLFISKEDETIFWVRRSYERTIIESEFDNVKPMNSFRDLSIYYGDSMQGDIYLESSSVSLDWWKMLTKYLPFENYKNIDNVLKRVRSIKSEYELALMKKSGELHHELLLNIIPSILREGMSEADLGAEIFERFLKIGYHGVSRFSMSYSEVLLGHICFGDNSLFPTAFDGASGTIGLSPAVAGLGSRDRLLKSGDYVYIDVASGYEGYHTDKTRIYKFGGQIDRDVEIIHNRCIDIQNGTADLLVSGAVPEEIFKTIWSSIDDGFKTNFMGFGSHQVKFLGHGVGLYVDEYPVIAEKFKEPLEENMTIAVEPKKGIVGIGMVGVEDTYLVTDSGGVCITGNDNKKIIKL